MRHLCHFVSLPSGGSAIDNHELIRVSVVTVSLITVTNLPDDAAPTTPPELPKPLVDLTPAVVVGTSIWVIALVTLVALAVWFDVGADLWIRTSIAGVGLGGVGLGIVGWQRHASRSGSRGAQRGL